MKRIATALLVLVATSMAHGADALTTEPPVLAPPEGGEGVAADNGAQNNPLEDEMTPELTEAIERGLVYLKQQQNVDGSFGRGKYGKHVGITALCALAFMADGHVPGRGEYGEQVQRALDFVLSYTTETGLLPADVPVLLDEIVIRGVSESATDNTVLFAAGFATASYFENVFYGEGSAFAEEEFAFGLGDPGSIDRPANPFLVTVVAGTDPGPRVRVWFRRRASPGP